MLASRAMACLTGLGVMEIRVVIQYGGFMARRAELVVVDHLCACDLRNCGSDFRELPFLPVRGGLNTVRSRNGLIYRLPAKSGQRTWCAARHRRHGDQTHYSSRGSKAEFAVSFTAGHMHRCSPESRT